MLKMPTYNKKTHKNKTDRKFAPSILSSNTTMPNQISSKTQSQS